VSMTFEKPLPVPTEDSAPYWEACKKHELRMQRCRQCGHFRFPPSVICPKCTSLAATWEKLSGKGTIYTYILIHRPYHPAFSAEAPYNVAVVKLDEGPLLHSNIVDCKNDELRIGMPVEVTFEDASDTISLPKFRPIGS
jgi:uncharacterized OB-fold protein